MNVVDYNVSYYEEDKRNVKFNLQDNNTRLIVRFPRLPSNGEIRIDTNLSYSNVNILTKNDDEIQAAVSYNEEIRVSNFDFRKDNIIKTFEFPPPKDIFPKILSIIFPVIIIIVFFLPKIYNKIKKWRLKVHREKFIFNVKKEISTIRNILEKNVMSKDILIYDTWDSRSDNEDKLRIFGDYDYYKQIKSFYNKVKERHSYLLNNEMTDDMLKSKT